MLVSVTHEQIISSCSFADLDVLEGLIARQKVYLKEFALLNPPLDGESSLEYVRRVKKTSDGKTLVFLKSVYDSFVAPKPPSAEEIHRRMEELSQQPHTLD